MSKQLISQYYNKVDKLIQFGGSRKETSVRNEFYNLLSHYAEKKHLVLIAELPIRGTKGKDVTPDGTLKNILRLDYGYWESKDESLDLDEEIDKKVKKGYPLNNILFEDSNLAILFQDKEEVMRINMRNPDELDRILTAFINFEKPEVRKFNDALDHFQKDIPTILKTLREKIDTDGKANKRFIKAADTYLALCKAEINPDITMADVREMMIQHILTSDIFNKIFDDAEFHQHNSIAKELELLIGTLFSYSDRKNLLASIEHYYDAINATAAGIADHHEKQKFLKSLYENFYKAYNPKAADRLGVVYTPNEIVDFMIDSTNFLLEKHFKRLLWDKNVDILDPATGTGTFICNIIDKCPPQYLAHKYKHELHANDVAILPYYISNLNIEYTFKQKMNYYEEFKNLCFVDTLDNTDALAYGGKQHDLFGLSSENSRRIVEQNKRKISVVIGNPPYNANQKNENEHNKNREYPYIDKRIKDTYIKNSIAQKTKVYDMYSRFYRWASDRIDNNGVITLITNNSFINARTFDGFRKSIQSEFDFAYIIDLGGNIRELSGKDGIFLNEEHTIFGVSAAVGIAIMWLVKLDNSKIKNCQVNYIHPCDIRATRKEKLSWISGLTTFNDIGFDKLNPDKNNNWINISTNDFETLLPLADKKVKSGKGKEAVFKLFSTGINSGRDEWVTNFNTIQLTTNIKFYIGVFNQAKSNNEFSSNIKWSRNIKNKLKNDSLAFNKINIVQYLYRPFLQKYLYVSDILIDERSLSNQLYKEALNEKNLSIVLTGPGSEKPFFALSTQILNDYHFVGAGASSQCLPLYNYNEKGERTDNITDWGKQQFEDYYYSPERTNATVKSYQVVQFGANNNRKGTVMEVPGIQKTDIFHYVYAVLHNPAYRKKYELNLKREFPRIPFYENFWQWAKWGKQLMELHINYETVKQFPLEFHQHNVKAESKRQKEIFTKAEEPQPLFGHQPKVKAKLKADKNAGVIELDELSFLTGLPKEAWEYKLGNRSALEWVLDQYKEKKPTDPTIAEKFNTYRFADYKEHVIELLKRVCTVSVETMKIIGEMEKVRTHE